VELEKKKNLFLVMDGVMEQSSFSIKQKEDLLAG
jgi:hypothetical protein